MAVQSIVQIVPAVTLLTAVLFLVTAALAARNYRETIRISNYWGIFSIAMVLGAFTLVVEALELLDIMDPVMQEVGGPLFIGFLVALIIASLESITSKAHISIR